ncbi:MAG: succinate dehydrogenase [Chloroflexi bacterium]|nr:succinate dehydrogenase [Chloroflexota bacterium]
MRTARQRPPTGSFQVMSWLFMRVTGLLLLVIAVFHMFWMHFIIGVEKIDFNTIVSRWTGPHGAFWRLFDVMLLTFAFTHGINGATNVADDYITSRGWRVVTRTALWILWFALVMMGLWIIYTFRPDMPTPFK